MYVCMHVYVYVYIYMYICMCLCACLCACAFAQIDACKKIKHYITLHIRFQYMKSHDLTYMLYFIYYILLYIILYYIILYYIVLCQIHFYDILLDYIV